MGIDLDGPEPLYVQIADDILRRIAAGELRAGRRIPSARGMAAEYEVSTRTSEAAIQRLKEQGAVVAVHGRGTFVVQQNAPEDESSGA